ncbi:MAG: coenzyme F420 hydrogenase, partial [Candidatus Altiarchaeales archaeon HGW-Altiarchaeales-2]
MNTKILICGIGNLLMSDDGFAHYVIEILESKLD